MARYDYDYEYPETGEPRRRRSRWLAGRRREGRPERGRRPRRRRPPRGREPERGREPYGAEYPGYGRPGMAAGRERTRFGPGPAPEREEPGYGREYGKTRWETDFGDPFRDRERGTPIRMMRGGWHTYGREYYGRSPERGGYGYEYEFRPRGRRRRQY